MPQRKTLQELCDERYDDPAVAKIVYDDAIKHKTGDLILAGKCTLPHPKDAYRHYLRVTGQENVTKKEREQQQQITDLQSRLEALESRSRTPATGIMEGV